jgi:hypothetical protein
MSEKYGFVYIWYDRKHKRFYIGSHWGTEDDGYICSSTWMRNAYKRRPTDFKRKILKHVKTNRNDLLLEEHRWLLMIPKESLGKNYYNMTQHLNGHWETEEERRLSLVDKISLHTKEAMQRPDVRKKYLAGLQKRNSIQSIEAKKKRSESMKRTMAKKFPIESRFKYETKFGSDEYKINMGKTISESWKHRDKKKIGKKISASLKGVPRPSMLGRKWWNNGSINRRSILPPDATFVAGKV